MKFQMLSWLRLGDKAMTNQRNVDIAVERTGVEGGPMLRRDMFGGGLEEASQDWVQNSYSRSCDIQHPASMFTFSQCNHLL